MGRTREKGRVAQKAIRSINKMKKPNGILAIGTKMLKKRRISLIIKSDIKLQQTSSVQLDRDKQLDARNKLEYLMFRRNVQKDPTNSRRSRIYKTKKTAKTSMPVTVTDPSRDERGNEGNSLPETRKVSNHILMSLIVPIIIKIEDCPEAEEMVREMQEKQVTDSDSAEDDAAAAGPGVTANSQFPVSKLFKDAAEFIRNALDSKLD